MMEAKKRELFFVERLSDYFNAVRELYERVCGKSYPDHNYAADDFLLLKLVGDRAELLRTKLDEWVQPCFCRGKAKCLMCETRTLLAGGAERRANKRARRTSGGVRCAAHGWAALAEYVRREIDEARAARDRADTEGNQKVANYWDGKQSALDELWNVFDAELQAPPNDELCGGGPTGG